MDNLGWHFVGETLRDGSPVPGDGVKAIHGGPLVLCENGLHLSRRILDALRNGPRHAPVCTICRVEFGHVYLECKDNIVSSERTILWRVDGEKPLRDFARKCALNLIHLWAAPSVVKYYLETGDENLRELAWVAVQDFLRFCVHSVERPAAQSAAWAASLEGAWYSAIYASWNALIFGGLKFPQSPLDEFQNTTLTNLVEREHQNASSKLV